MNDITQIMNQENTGNNNKFQEINDILNLLRKGYDNIKLSPNDDVTLLLGNTGCGKSTLAQFVVGDSEHLISVEVGTNTGEFIIVDKNDKVSNYSTVVSKTEFPDLMIDEYGTAYYDCPGFSDTRRSAYEIGATYFIKKILDSARSVKLIFVINYSSVRIGVDRKDFILLLTHVVAFIKNINRYEHSIALVVTKVDNNYIPELVPDNKLIKSIATFLKEVKNDIRAYPELLESGHSEANEFLDILLFNINNSSRKIALFRRPDSSGILSSVKLLQKSKIFLKKMINESLDFTRVVTDDFGYTLSSRSMLYMSNLLERVSKYLSDELFGLGEKIQQFYIVQEGETKEIGRLLKMFTKAYDIISHLQNEAIHDRITFQEYLNKTKQFVSDCNIKISDIHFSRIEKQKEYINFIYLINSQGQRHDKASVAAKALTRLSNYVKESQIWYTFLSNLHSKLSEYNIQKKRQQFTTNLQVELSSEKESIKFSEITFLPPLRRIITNFMKEFNGLKQIALNKPKLNLLNRVFDLTLNYRLECDYPTPDTLVLKGQFVKITDIKNSKYKGQIRFIQVFALDKMFFDAYLDLTGRGVQLTIIAPVWEVVGSQKIMLDGRSGVDKNKKAENGKTYGSNGSIGLPGLPGGPAGSLFGIGKKFINDKFLSISANGGNGGRGQEGGDGFDGCDAHPSWNGKLNSVIPLLLYNEATYTINGKRGGNGGDGGVGGYGGPKGKITVVAVDTIFRKTKVMVSAVNGKAGNGGAEGKGGQGGRNGCYTYRNFLIFFSNENLMLLDDRACDGDPGKQGHNDEGITEPSYITDLLDLCSVINNYKNYISMTESLKESYVRSFMNHMKLDQIKIFALGEKFSELYQNSTENHQASFSIIKRNLVITNLALENQIKEIIQQPFISRIKSFLNKIFRR